MLLWRCPLCAMDDALVQVSRRFRADRVCCRRCDAEWRMRRVPGDNFYLTLTRAGPDAPLSPGDERSVTAWYDLMKQSLRLTPLPDAEIPLQPGETLYLASGAVDLQAEESDPLFFPAHSPSDTARVDKRQVEGRLVGRGRLFLTDRQLVWLGDGRRYSFPLRRLNSAYAVMDFGLLLMVELRLYTLYFLEESLLKWLTHIALVGRQVEETTGHHITTSNF